MSSMSGSTVIPRVLSIAGTDPSGGAGIQADLKSIAAAGGYGMAAVTALVAQNTHGVRSVHVPPVAFLREQLDAVSDDVVIDAVKIGMLGSAEVTRTVSAWLAAAAPPVVVLDPVMVATSGDRLLDPGAEAALRELLPRVELVTPNLPELAVLCNEPQADSWPEALAQGRRLAVAYQVAVLVKGGHLSGDRSPDALVEPRPDGGTTVTEISTLRVNTDNTHGTGCSLSAAMATFHARLGSWEPALTAAKAWLQEALETADELDVGSGNGPVNHFGGVWARGLAPLPPAAQQDLAASRTQPPVSQPPVSQPPGAAGPLTQALWEESAVLRAGIDGLDFVRELGAGTLAGEAFEFYLAQDALYLRDYSRALARASELAPTTDEQAFWARSAHQSLAAELDLHRGWLPDREPATAGPVTRGYLDHLLGRGPGNRPDTYRAPDPEYAADLEYARLVGAVLPCFWVYADVGSRLHARSTPGHAYGAWLQTYADPGFAAATAQAVGILETVLSRSGAAGAEAAGEAFLRSVRWERDFFAARPEQAGGTLLLHQQADQ